MDTDTDAQLHDERIITVREEPSPIQGVQDYTREEGLDRKTNHHDLTKTETEEMFVLSKAIQENEILALTLEQSGKAVEAQEKAEALPKMVRPPLWRDKVSKLEWSEVKLIIETSRTSSCIARSSSRRDAQQRRVNVAQDYKPTFR